MIFYLVLFIFLVAFLGSILRIVPEYERGVVFRLGRCIGAKGPGIIILLPLGIDKIVKISLRTVTLDVPSQDVITKDNISVKVNAVVYFRVVEPIKAILNVENYHYATSQLAQTTLRSVCGQVELDKLLAERERINEELQKILDVQTENWGVKVMNVELKQIDLPQEMQRAMARQAEAERERRAKIINAEGELQAANMLSEASDILAKNPVTLQLRYLQTITEISSENNTTIVFPLPVDFLSHFMQKKDK